MEALKKRPAKPVAANTKDKARSEALDLAIGPRLKTVRELNGLSQRELAKRAGVTHSTISLIEQQSHAPSLASLHRILTAIPISLADFFAMPQSQKNVLFYDASEWSIFSRGAVDMRIMASERREKQLQLFYERYEPGTETGEIALVHDGETATIVIEGEIEIEIDGEVRRIGQGGGFQIFGSHPYRIRNVGDCVAVMVCACTPPMV